MSGSCKPFVSHITASTVVDAPAHGGSYPHDPYPVDYKPLMDLMNACADPLSKVKALSSWVFSNLSLGWTRIKEAFHWAVNSVFSFFAKFFGRIDPVSLRSAPKELVKRYYNAYVPGLSFLQRFLKRMRERLDPDSPILVDVFFRFLVGTQLMRTDDAEFASAILLSLKEAAGSWRAFSWHGVKVAYSGVKEGFRTGLRRGIKRETKAILTVAVCAHLALPPWARSCLINVGYNSPYSRRAILATVQGGLSLLSTAARGYSSNEKLVHAINTKATGLARGARLNLANGLQSSLAVLRPIPIFVRPVLHLAKKSARVTSTPLVRMVYATCAIFLGTCTTWRSFLWAAYLFSATSSTSAALMAFTTYLLLESAEAVARGYYTFTAPRASSN